MEKSEVLFFLILIIFRSVFRFERGFEFLCNVIVKILLRLIEFYGFFECGIIIDL